MSDTAMAAGSDSWSQEDTGFDSSSFATTTIEAISEELRIVESRLSSSSLKEATSNDIAEQDVAEHDTEHGTPHETEHAEATRSATEQAAVGQPETERVKKRKKMASGESAAAKASAEIAETNQLSEQVAEDLESIVETHEGEPAKAKQPQARSPQNSPPVVSDAAIAQFNSEIRRIDKIITVWGEARHLRFDNAHHGTAAQGASASDNSFDSPEESAAAKMTPEEEPTPLSQTNIFAVCLTFGGLLAIVLGAAHAIALSGPRLSHDIRIAAGFVCAGSLGVIFGLWFEVGRLRSKVRSLTDE